MTGNTSTPMLELTTITETSSHVVEAGIVPNDHILNDAVDTVAPSNEISSAVSVLCELE